MALRDLLRRRPAGAKAAALEVPLLRRLRDALRAPPAPNRYVVPRLRTVDAVAFAARGYRVFWTTPKVGPHGGVLASSVLVYVSLRPGYDPHDGPAVELPTIVPGEVSQAVYWLGVARHIGWRAATTQAVAAHRRDAAHRAHMREHARERGWS